jgi:hypothetical protein
MKIIRGLMKMNGYDFEKDWAVICLTQKLTDKAITCQILFRTY